MGTQEIDGFLLDIGGVLYQGDALIPGARQQAGHGAVRARREGRAAALFFYI